MQLFPYRALYVFVCLLVYVWHFVIIQHISRGFVLRRSIYSKYGTKT